VKWWGQRRAIAFIPVTQYHARTVMETVVLRVLLLIFLFILLTGDYTTLFNQILQQGAKSVPTPPDVSRTDDDTDDAQIDDTLDIHCEYFISLLLTTLQ
jgi:hypothetical protein